MGQRPAAQPMPPADRSTRLLWVAYVDSRRRANCHCRCLPFFIIVSRIENSEIFANGTRCLLRLRPDDRLISGHTLGLVHICLDQARIDRKRFTADQPRRDTRRHHTLKYPPQGITLTKALMPCAAEHRMIGNAVLDVELAKPPVRKIDLHLGANLPLRADRKYVTHKQHP